MQRRSAILLIGVILTVGFSAVGGVGIVDVSAADTLVVDNDGTAEYSSIQAAIDNASAGETVEIRSGTYPETIVVDKNITVTAPDGATLDGTNVDDSDIGVKIGSFENENVEATIRGITITRYEDGITARDSDGNWVLADVTVRIAQDDGIDVDDSSGDWTIRNSEISSTGFDGISAGGSNGEWIIEDTVIRRTELDAVDAESTFDDWTIRNVSIEDSGISATRSADDWVIEQSSIQGGISIDDSNGKWEIRQSVITDDVPITATDTLGEWRITQSIIIETSTSSFDEGTAIDAEGSIAEGIATDNWWGSPSGPDENACVGNVDCSNPLTTRPSDVGYDPDDESESTPTPTPTPPPDETDNPSPSQNRGAAAGVTPYTTTDDVLGGVGDNAVIFQGEEDIIFETTSGDEIDPSSLERIGGDNEGVTLSFPIPQDQPRGEYAENLDGTGFSVAVQEPRVTTLEVQNNGENDVSGGILESDQDDASVLVEYNYEEAENIELTVEDENGVDVTGEALDAGEADNKNADSPPADGSTDDGVVRFELNPGNLDEGDYTFSVAGVEDLDFGLATQSVPTTVAANQPASLSLSEDKSMQGSDTTFTIENSPEGEFHPVVVESNEFRDGVSLAQAEDIFRNVGDTVETGVANSSGPGAADVSGVEYAYAIVEIDGGNGFGSVETQFLDDSSATIELYPSDGVTPLESHPAGVVFTLDDGFEADDQEDLDINTPSPTDVTRTVSSSEAAPGSTVTLTTEITGVNGRISVKSGYDPQVSSATVQTTVNGEATDPLVSAATVSGSAVTLGDVGTNATVTVTEELTVGEQLNVTHNITGDVTLESTKTNFEPVSVTVADRDTEPQSVVDEFDEDGNGNIEITELGQAGQAFASGELTITELGEIGAEFAS